MKRRFGCGTNAGYNYHLNHGTPVCEPCRLAHRAHTTSWNRSRGMLPRAERNALRRPACGTAHGYQWHRRHNEPACDDCKAAHAACHRDGVAVRRPRFTAAVERLTAAPEAALGVFLSWAEIQEAIEGGNLGGLLDRRAQEELEKIES